jgi:pyridoxine kinase
MPILSVQSHVAYGRVGNRAAVFALERLGHDVWPVNTVSFSNHPAFGSYKGGVYRASDIAEICEEIEKRGAFRHCAAVLTGYLGDAEIGRTILSVVRRVRAANPRMVFVLDPVIGDARRGRYVAEGLTEFFRDEAVPLADIVIPNLFELTELTGQPAETAEEAAVAAALLLARGPALAVITGLRHGNSVSAVLAAGAQAWQATAPWVEVAGHGAGDLFSALFLGHYLLEADARLALGKAVHAVHRVLARTKELGLDSLALVQAQNELLARGSAPALPLWAV